jgi:hypothetical protein
MVSNGEDAVEAIREGEFNDKVHGDGLKGKGGAVGRDGAVGDTGTRGNGFSGLTGGATADERGDEGFQVGPPVILSNEEAGFENAGVACGGGIMV